MVIRNFFEAIIFGVFAVVFSFFVQVFFGIVLQILSGNIETTSLGFEENIYVFLLFIAVEEFFRSIFAIFLLKRIKGDWLFLSGIGFGLGFAGVELVAAYYNSGLVLSVFSAVSLVLFHIIISLLVTQYLGRVGFNMLFILIFVFMFALHVSYNLLVIRFV